ncbi:hypothetical protein IWX90DRAFT_212872 [Phyllosticta citrichinensis]|uniref:Uncharacterized protein n=1 Tax=Phyllosticta citrichinensis TaxID=1130410 RepID=A0ABR1XT13_9PEZI
MLCIRVQHTRTTSPLALAKGYRETRNAKPTRLHSDAFPPSPHVCTSCVRCLPLIYIPFISLALPVPATAASQPVINILPVPVCPSTRCPKLRPVVRPARLRSSFHGACRWSGERHLPRNPMPQHPPSLPLRATPQHSRSERACVFSFFSRSLACPPYSLASATPSLSPPPRARRPLPPIPTWISNQETYWLAAEAYPNSYGSLLRPGAPRERERGEVQALLGNTAHTCLLAFFYVFCS